METLNDLYKRHEREMQELMNDQLVSWNALRDKYGPGDFPDEIYQQWNQQYGNVRLNGLQAQQQAELEAYPLNPLEYRYQNEAQQAVPASVPADLFEQLKQQQQQNAQDVTAKRDLDPNSEPPDDIFSQLRRKQERNQDGPDYER